MVGYALKWGQPAWVTVDGKVVEERFAKGAFLSSIAGGKVRLCVDHCWDDIVARQDDGSLHLVEDSVGLRITATANHTDAGDVAMEAVRTRYRAGLSVSFNRPLVEWQNGEDGRVRMITSARLLEVSVCRNPAYRSSEIHAGKMRIERFTASLPDPRLERLEAAEAAMAKYRSAP
ncbi:HK97 family phage prohead protease [Phyllobacterium sp. SL163]|uniref:HK97 family phage prohead protease n=1 Tax=unclassified Phyllobacterium TaxID=2638441 RepID=UPI003CF48863